MDGEDLKAFNVGVKTETFVYYLICIDFDEDIREKYVSRIYFALNTPHSKLLVLSFSRGKRENDVERTLGVLSGNINVRIEEFSDLKLQGRMNIESLISAWEKLEKSVIKKIFSRQYLDRTYPVYTSVVYLTISLKNVLRRNTSFEYVAVEILIELVFKLVLMSILMHDGI